MTRSRSSSLTSDNFEDALSEEEEDDEEDEDDDYFQDEDLEEEKKKKEVEKMKEMAIAQDKKRNTTKVEQKELQQIDEEPVKTNPSRMSFILPALQNHGFSDEDDDDDDDNASLKDPNDIRKQEDIKEDQEKHEVGSSSSSSDLVAEIEALEVASTPVAAAKPVMVDSPVIEKSVAEKPATYEPIPVERPYIPPTPIIAPEEKEEPLETVKQSVADEIHTVKQQSEHKLESEATPTLITIPTVNVPAVIPITTEIKDELEAKSEAKIEDSIENVEQENKEIATVDHTDSGISIQQQQTARSSQESLTTGETTPTTSREEEREPEKPSFNHLAAILPAVEESAKHVKTEKPKVSQSNEHILPEDHDRAKYSREFEYPIEEPVDLDMFKDNVISIQAIDPKDIPVNNTKPHEQEKAGKNSL